MDQQAVQGLVVQAQQGDQDAFAEIYTHFAPKIHNYLYYHLNGRTHLAEDLTEEVFVKVLEKIQNYQDRGLPFSAWLFRIAHNHLIDHVRSLPKAGTVSLDECQDLQEQHAEQSLESALNHTELVRALRHLTEDQRRVVVLRFLQGMSTLETARALGKTEDAVKKLQARGLLVLRKILSGARPILAVA